MGDIFVQAGTPLHGTNLQACLLVIGVQKLESSARTCATRGMSQEHKECPAMPRKIEKLEESVVNRIAAGEVSCAQLLMKLIYYSECMYSYVHRFFLN